MSLNLIRPIAAALACAPADMNDGRRSERAGDRHTVTVVNGLLFKLKVPESTWLKALKKNSYVTWREEFVDIISAEKAHPV